MNYEQRDQIGRTRDDEDRYVASGLLKNLPDDQRDKHPANGACHPADSDNGTDRLFGKHI